jgi:PAS domain S-box-containing protein
MEDANELLNIWMETVRDYAIFLVDLTGCIASWNVGAERILGYQESEVVGLPLAIFFTPEDRDQGVPALELETAKSHGRASDDRWHVRKDGSQFWCGGMLTAVRDERGSVRGLVKVMRDLTERKVMEEELRARADALLAANLRRNEFLAVLSHELRNPLAPILMSLYVLKRRNGTDDPVLEQARAMIERQVMNLKRLIDDLLEVSRMALNRIDLHRETVDLSIIAARAVEDVRPLMQERGHEVTVTTEPGRLWVLADPVRLEQVVASLLTNAAKFTDPGGTIWLTIEREGDHAVVRVRDTGIGIAAEMLDRTFDLFAQADQGLARARGGLGIGLTLARALVTLHGGTIEARSEGAGKGSEFLVRLPLDVTEVRVLSALEGPDAAPDSVGIDPAARSGRRLLIVDDNIDAARSLERFLKDGGYDVELAHDGPTALELVRHYQPDVALLDIGLPHLDGYAVALQARQEKPVSLIALTGYAPEPRARSLFDRYLIKPVQPDELLKVLRELGQ